MEQQVLSNNYDIIANQVKKTLEEVSDLCMKKNKGYATDSTDFFSAFNEGCILTETFAEDYLLTLCTKHIISVFKLIEYDYPEMTFLETVREKIRDIIAYMAILDVMVEERFKME